MLVVIAIGVVIRLLVAELARSAAPPTVQVSSATFADHRTVERAATKAPVSAVRAADRSGVRRPVEVPPAPRAGVDEGPDLVADGDLLIEVAPRPRSRDVRRVTKVAWWRRLRSGTALALLVALLGVATAAVIGAIVLFFAFVLEQAIN